MLEMDHIYLIWLGCGHGTNSKDEFVSVWGMLLFSFRCGVLSLQVNLGDSNIIIDWATGSSTLQVVLLEKWCTRANTLLS